MEERAYAFHQWTLTDMAKHFEVDLSEGLSDTKVHFRLERNGYNSLDDLKDISVYKIFLRQFSNFFIILLFVAAIISYFVDGLFQSFILLFIIAANVSLGFSQEYKAEKAIEELQEGYKSKARVIRNGALRQIPARELVVGDIVLIESGDKVPADLRIIEENSLRVDESSLTGESGPVGKKEIVFSLDTSLADRKNMLYASTIVVSGRGKGLVVSAGKDTEFGKIAGLITESDSETPLQKQVLYLGKLVTFVAFVFGIIVFGIGIYQGNEWAPLLTFSIALIVAAVPEGLPTAITLCLAMGVSRMAKEKAIVRKMAVVETLGTINIIATDKTGTLTNNKLSVESIGLFQDGAIKMMPLTEISSSKNLDQFFSLGSACCNTDFAVKELSGDPLEVAIVGAARELFQSEKIVLSKHNRLMEIPFDSDKQYMAVLCGERGEKRLVAKGTTEKIVGFSNLTESEKEFILGEATKLSSQGYKIIALASKNAKGATGSSLRAMTFLGFFALVDEPTPGIKDTLKQVMAAGIRPVILTGDHLETAKFVANKIGLNVTDDEIIDDAEFHKLSPAKLREAIKKVKIFARISPGDKLVIVQAFQKAGYCVAVTGDGVNDAPALKESNVGIAMGIKGTDIAKDSADIVLSDDRYKTILSAIEYGRTIHDNIKNIVAHLVSGNLNEIALVGVAFMLGLPSPITTLQILWINLITETIPALSYSFEEPRKKVMLEKPRPNATNSIKPTVIYAGYLAAVAFVLCLGVFFYGLHISSAKAQTITFSFFVFIKLAFSFSLRSKERIWQNPRSFFENKYLIVATVLSAGLQFLLFSEPFKSAFNLVSLNSEEKMVLASLIIFAFLIAELIRYGIDRRSLRVVKS